MYWWILAKNSTTRVHRSIEWPNIHCNNIEISFLMHIKEFAVTLWSDDRPYNDALVIFL